MSHATSDRTGWWALGILVVLTALLRLGLVDVPLERDEGEYAYAGQMILQGVAPYESVHNMKLPGVYVAYAAILELFGETHRGIHGALILVNGLTGILLFDLARRLLGLPGALSAAACFLLLSASPAVLGMSANAEHFVLLFAVAGLDVMLAGRGGGVARCFLSGLLLGIAFLMKQHGAAFGVLGIGILVGRHLLERPAEWRTPAAQFAGFGAGWILPYLVVCGVLYRAGVFDAFWFWTVEYARSYATRLPPRSAWQNLWDNGWPVVQSAPLLWLLAAGGILLLPTARMEKEHKAFLVCFALLSLLAITPGFYFRSHYFLLLLPVAALLAGLGLSRGVDLALGRRPLALRHAAAACLLGVALGHSLYAQRESFFTLSPFELTRATYWLNPFYESLPVAEYVRTHTRAGDRIAVIGSEPQIYFYAHRRSVNGFIYMYPLMEENSFALEMQRKFAESVERERPAYVIFVRVPTSWSPTRNSHPYLFDWFERYRSENLEMVGSVEIYDDRSEYHWDADLKWPVASRFWIAIFRDRRA